MSAELAHQLSIFVANKPGVLGKVCDLLKKEKINIFAHGRGYPDGALVEVSSVRL